MAHRSILLVVLAGAAFASGCSSASSDDKDSGAGDSGTTDTGDATTARLTGDLSLWIKMAGFGDDTCRGTITIDVDLEATPPFSGTATCAFRGDFERLGTLDGVLEGDFVGDTDEVEGVSVVSAPGQDPTELPWSGIYDGSSLVSHVEDSVSGDRFDIDYIIDFDARR